MHGHLDACARLEVSGWAYEPKTAGRRVFVEAVVDGVVVARSQADRLRPDLAAAGIGDGRHAYLLNLPPHLHDGQPHRLQVFARDGDATVELAGSPQDFISTEADAIRGALHVLEDGLIAGWALSRREPGGRRGILVTVNGVPQPAVLADGYRADLHMLGLGDGYHGFQLALPTTLLQGGEIEVSAFDAHTQSPIPPGTLNDRVDNTYWGDLLAWQASAESDRAALRRRLIGKDQPLLSVVMPVYEAPPSALAAAISSVRTQSYTNWQLCIADDASRNPEIRRLLEPLCAEDPRIEVVWREQNGHISAASNSALALVRGDYIALLDHDDLLHPDALLHVAATIAEHPEAGIIFSDEDKCDEQGNRYGPYRKPGWNPDLMDGQNMVSHLGVYRSELVRQVGGFRIGLEGSQDYDLALRVRRLLRPAQIRHIPEVLYHWRAVAGSTARNHSEKAYAAVAMRRALRDDLRARGERGEVSPRLQGVVTRFRPALPEPKPAVTIVLGGWHDRRQRRHQAVQSVRAAAWAGVQVRVLESKCVPSPALMPADDPAQVVVWLGTQVRPFKQWTGWLRELVAQVMRPGVGLVGGKVLDEQQRIHSFGNDSFSRRLHGTPAGNAGPSGVARLCRTVEGVDGHAFAVRRHVLTAWADSARTSGGFVTASADAWSQALCEQAHVLGLRCLVTPYAQMTLLPVYQLQDCTAPTD